VINIKDSKLYCCFSVPLRDYLIQKGIRYEVFALNPTSQLPMWIFIKDEKLKTLLGSWSRGE
jgi:hypothetical protein